MEGTNLLLLATLVSGSTSFSSEVAPRQNRPEEQAGALRRALGRAIAAASARPSLELLVECREAEGLNSMRLFGEGLGIWNGERQFRLDTDRVAALLRALNDADFPGLEDIYGGSRELAKPAAAPDCGAAATLLTCRIELTLGEHHKQVVQLARGEQSVVVRQLAEDLLGIAKPFARLGLGASNLHDGLQKLARGKLALETWALMLHRKPDEGSVGLDDQGFLLTIFGTRATSRRYAAGTGYQQELVLVLSPSEIRRLVRELDAVNPSAWPANLYAAGYTDLSLRVLNHEKAIQARPFAGLGPTTHGQRQKAFEQALEILKRVQLRVLERGRPAPN